MSEFTKTQPAGRMIARLFAQVGWAIVLLGVALAAVAALLGRFPGAEAASDPVSILARVLAALPGIGVALFGLFCVLMAAQTRAVIDSADIAREMLVLARRRPISLLAAIPPLGEVERAPSARVPPLRGNLQGEDGSAGDAAPARAPAVAAPVAAARSEQAAERTGEARKEPRAEPIFATRSRVKPAPGKVHPIFSARPPR